MGWLLSRKILLMFVQYSELFHPLPAVTKMMSRQTIKEQATKNITFKYPYTWIDNDPSW
jgi:hypothetical protein